MDDRLAESYGSLKEYLDDFRYGERCLKELGLEESGIHPAIVRSAEARLDGKGRLVDTKWHCPAKPGYSKKDVADATLVIRVICKRKHKRPPKWNADEKKWYKRFWRDTKFLAGLVFATGIVLLLWLYSEPENFLLDDAIEKTFGFPDDAIEKALGLPYHGVGQWLGPALKAVDNFVNKSVSNDLFVMHFRLQNRLQK